MLKIDAFLSLAESVELYMYIKELLFELTFRLASLELGNIHVHTCVIVNGAKIITYYDSLCII